MNIKQTSTLLVLFLGSLYMSGCASIISDSTYSVSITSTPERARILIKDKTGKTVFRGKTPAIVSLDAEEGFFEGQTYTVYFKKRGYARSIAEIDSKIDGWYWANLFFGGVIGMLIVDPWTGAMWKLEDQHLALFPMYAKHRRHKGKHGARDIKTLHIALLEEIPPRLRSKMIRINRPGRQ